LEWLTPQLLFQSFVYVASMGVGFGMMRAKLTAIEAWLKNEQRLREEHGKTDDESFHDIRGELGALGLKVAILETKVEHKDGDKA